MTCKQQPSPSQTHTLQIWRTAKETLERSIGPFSTVLFKMISMRSDKPICAPTRLSQMFAVLRLKGRPDVTVVVDWALKINYLPICLPTYLSVCVCLCLSVCLSVSVSLSLSLSVSLCLSLSLSINQSTSLSLSPSLSLPACLPIYLTNCKIYLYICMYLPLKLFQR